MGSVLRELEELRNLLETPKKTFTPLRDSAAAGPSTAAAATLRANADAPRQYGNALSNQALTSAEVRGGGGRRLGLQQTPWADSCARARPSGV